MPSPIGGNPAKYPTTLDIPDDTDPPDAADVNTPLESLADRTAFLFARLIASPVKSWRALNAQTHKLIAAAWDSRGQWWGVSTANVDTVATSNDEGDTWNTTSPGSSSVPLTAIAVDVNGAVVTVGLDTHLYEWNGTSTWTTHSPITLVNVSGADVAWESVNALWAVYATTDAAGWTGGQFLTSTDRATWTDQSAHLDAKFIAGDGSHSSPARHVSAGGGRLVVSTMLNGVGYIQSADASAPTVWSSLATLTPTLTCTQMSAPVYIPSANTWLVVLRKTASITAVEIWASTDGGQHWTAIKTLGGTTRSVKVEQLAVLDPLVVGLNTDGNLLYSVDAGVTWQAGPMRVGQPGATSRSIWAGDGGFLELDVGGSSDGSHHSICTGAPNAQTVGV